MLSLLSRRCFTTGNCLQVDVEGLTYKHILSVKAARMKFGKEYHRYLAESGLENSPHVAFKPLKKILKKCGRSTSVQQQPPCPPQIAGSHKCSNCEDLFFEELIANMRAVLSDFEVWAHSLLNKRVSIPRILSIFKSVKNGRDTAESCMKLLEFAAINHLAFLKILKKFKKVHGYSPEREPGLDLFRLNRQLVLSPHLLEISAMEVNVGDTMKPHTSSYTHLLASTIKALPASTSPPTEHPPSCCDREYEEAEGFCEDGTSGEEEALPRRVLDEWSTGESRPGEEETHVCGLRMHLDASCPICLDKFFKPVALSCGHVFCQLCACEAASIPSTFGLRHASRTKRCPVCRQAGVYRAAMELREVAVMLKKGDRQYWNVRNKEANKERKRQMSDYWQIAAGPPT